MSLFYHATPLADLPAIQSQGLVPRIGGRSQMIGEEAAAIYLFDDLPLVDDAIGGWLGDALEDAGITEIAILEIDAEAVVEPSQDGFSHATTHPIPAHAIRLLRIEPLDP